MRGVDSLLTFNKPLKSEVEVERLLDIDMAQTNLNVRVDKDVKQQAEELFADLGMNMTTAINVFFATNHPP